MTRLYLAYGSNMNKTQMRQRCPAAKPIKTIVVHDARLVFRGVADIEFAEGASVPCALWEITEACERALDRYEGIASGVYKKLMIPLDNGEQALTYVMCTKGIYPPRRDYYQRIVEGYADFEVPLEPLEVALKHSHVKQEHSAATRRRMVRDVAQGRGALAARKPTHIALDHAKNGFATPSAIDNSICRHGWPQGVCEECVEEAEQRLLPLPKPDPRYDGYNWSERAKAGTAKQRVVYETRDEAKTKLNVRRGKNTRVIKTKHKNLSDYMRAKGYSGEPH